jgi:hypothetical protein
MVDLVTSISSRNQVTVTVPGPQGPRGKTILNGTGAPSNNNGLAGDFYFDTVTNTFYGPKLSDSTWVGAQTVVLGGAASGGDYAFSLSWEVGSVTGPVDGIYSRSITHNLGFYPNVTIKDSAGNILETGIDYNSLNQITLTMAQPFGGTAYLS